MAFKSSVVDALGSYVYCLVDPRDNRISMSGKEVGIEFLSMLRRHCSNAVILLREDE